MREFEEDIGKWLRILVTRLLFVVESCSVGRFLSNHLISVFLCVIDGDTLPMLLQLF